MSEAAKKEPMSPRAVRHSFTLTDNETGDTYELPILHANIGPRVIDIRKLYAEAGIFTYDPGFTSTASCTSDITYIDGDAFLNNIYLPSAFTIGSASHLPCLRGVA